MNAAATAVLAELPDRVWCQRRIVLYSIGCVHSLKRGQSKLVMIVVSMWTACCVFPVAFFTDVSLTAPLPSFDGRAVQCPSVQNLRDYMSWRQVHCELAFHGERVGAMLRLCASHINHLYDEDLADTEE
jgi:tRNA(His) guanylyltransferase